jgi:hypothetical protein
MLEAPDQESRYCKRKGDEQVMIVPDEEGYLQSSIPAPA